jgi:hypothetical protein
MNLLKVVEGERLGCENASDHLLDTHNVFETFFEGKRDVMFHKIPLKPQEEEHKGEDATSLGRVPRRM